MKNFSHPLAAHAPGSNLTTLSPQSTSNSPRASLAKPPLLTVPCEFELAPDGEPLETKSEETQAEDFREFQLILDPNFLCSVHFFSFQPGRVIGARRRRPNSTQILESVQDPKAR